MEFKKPKKFIPDSIIVTKKNYKKGMRVQRGPNWIWKDAQDLSGHTVGTVIKYSHNDVDPTDNYKKSDWVIVKWEDTDEEAFYRIGPRNHDLIISKQ